MSTFSKIVSSIVKRSEYKVDDYTLAALDDLARNFINKVSNKAIETMKLLEKKTLNKRMAYLGIQTYLDVKCNNTSELVSEHENLLREVAMNYDRSFKKEELSNEVVTNGDNAVRKFIKQTYSANVGEETSMYITNAMVNFFEKILNLAKAEAENGEIDIVLISRMFNLVDANQMKVSQKNRTIVEILRNIFDKHGLIFFSPHMFMTQQAPFRKKFVEEVANKYSERNNIEKFHWSEGSIDYLRFMAEHIYKKMIHASVRTMKLSSTRKTVQSKDVNWCENDADLGSDFDSNAKSKQMVIFKMGSANNLAKTTLHEVDSDEPFKTRLGKGATLVIDRSVSIEIQNIIEYLLEIVRVEGKKTVSQEVTKYGIESISGNTLLGGYILMLGSKNQKNLIYGTTMPLKRSRKKNANGAVSKSSPEKKGNQKKEKIPIENAAKGYLKSIPARPPKTETSNPAKTTKSTLSSAKVLSPKTKQK